MNYEIHFHCPGGIAKTFHASFERMLDTLESRECRMDSDGLYCLNPHKQRIPVQCWREEIEIPPLDIARAWYGEFAVTSAHWDGIKARPNRDKALSRLRP